MVVRERVRLSNTQERFNLFVELSASDGHNPRANSPNQGPCPEG